jgi:beta-lactam-binding protein with PASTA domain
MKFKLKLPDFSKLPKPSDLKLPVDLSKLEKLDREHYNLVAWGLGAIIVLMVVAGCAAFFLSLRGAEETMVPDVKGMDLPSALVKLQDKELYPRISLRFTDDPTDKGRIVEEKPLPGTIVKAGRRINLTVSRGPVVDKVENYVGQDLNEVKIHLQTLFASAKALVTIKEPPVYVFDKAPAGTVLEQKPPADTKIDGLIALELVVSRGPEKAQVSTPDLKGLSFSGALAQIEKSNVAVTFTMRKADRTEKAGTVVSQTPAAGSFLPSTGRMEATVTLPDAQKGMVAGIFERDLPEYPYPLKVSLEVLLPTGERQLLVRMNHLGGKFSAPYFLPDASILILSVLDREVARFEVKTP